MVWPKVPLSTLCDILDNLRKPITLKDRVDGPYPYYGATGILSYVNDFIFDEELVLVGEDGAKWGAGDNSAFKISGKTWVNNHAHVLRPLRDKVLDEWLIYYLNGTDLSDFITGLTVPKLNQGKLKEIPIPLPPIEEQKRIVAILDQAFSDIDQARATAETNLKNARELFDSYLQQVFSQGGECRATSNLEDLVSSDCSLSYGIVQPGEEYPTGLPVVRPTDLTSKIIHLNGLKLIDPKLADSYKRTTLQGGELLLCVRGATGVISIASDELKGANVTRGIVPVRFKPDKLIQKYGYYQFISRNIQKQISEKTYGAALMQINIRDVKKLKFSLPPIEEQKEVILTLDEITKLVELLENVYQNKVEKFEELKKSILQKAFTGELTKSKGIAA